jgi:hypothetical protein
MNWIAVARGGAGAAALAGVLIALGGCASSGFDSFISPLPAAPTAKVTGAPLGATGATRASEAPPDVSMAGRWTLAANTGACGMNFGGAPDAAEGTIAPEGGCPGRFFTSRKWSFERGSLVIRDHQDKPLAQLAMSSPTRFEGPAASGLQLTLSR